MKGGRLRLQEESLTRGTSAKAKVTKHVTHEKKTQRRCVFFVWVAFAFAYMVDRAYSCGLNRPPFISRLFSYMRVSARRKIAL